jgi:hypothetical protein
MKKAYFIFLFTIFLCVNANAQSSSELVLGIPECHQTHNEWDKVKKALQTLDGVEIKGICTRHDSIVLQVNRNLIPANQLIFDKIKSVDAKYTIFIKKATLETMMEMCSNEVSKPK